MTQGAYLKNRKLLKFLKIWIGMFVGVGFLYLAVKNTDLNKTLSLIKNISLWPLLAIIALRTFALLIRGFRWRTVLEHVKIISPFTLFRISSIGEMGNYLFPARIGEVMRIYLLSKKEQIPKSATLASVFVDRILDVMTVLTVLFLFSFFVSTSNLVRDISYIAFAALLIFVSGSFVLLLIKDKFKNFIRSILSSFPDLTIKINQFIDRFIYFLSGLRNAYQVIRALGISLFLWSIHTLSFYFVLMALNVDVPWYASVIAVTVIGLGMTIPSTPGFVGTYEFFCVTSLAIFSVDKSSAFACAVLSHGLQYIVVIGVGVISYFWENIQFSKISLLKTEGILLESRNQKQIEKENIFNL